MLTRAWMLLFAAGIFEIAWAVAMKQSRGLTRLWPTVLTAGAMLVSVYLLARALRWLPVGTAYAVWTGIGAVGTAIIGMAVLGEPRSAARVLSIALIVAGIVGLHLAEGR